jgi:hypothetical protein
MVMTTHTAMTTPTCMGTTTRTTTRTPPPITDHRSPITLSTTALARLTRTHRG